ncbi:hypothetical protein [Erythrobacter sp. EC-HK427]|uniref:hypothetical protein n=1 Tax=Erythrobacter sp. EC-HK427 TaxID=2038396 RepID=UPI0012510EF2|nr:hypothetical protein [Erythrobacter sp. EC-HK427]VVT18421.1 conserved exported hypothetical protein [Erythrobacter sp. EC-HK427]
MFAKQSPLIALLLFAVTSASSFPALAQDDASHYDYRQRTRELAFDPQRFFPERPEPWMEIVYSGDDYGYPVYSIGILLGCTSEDVGEARRGCGSRMIARMVRAPFNGEPPRPRNRGQALFGFLYESGVSDDASLREALGRYRLEWLETDVSECGPAMAMMEANPALSFFALPLVPRDPLSGIALHTDKIRFVHRDSYLFESTYYGALWEDSPGAWADEFAQSLEACWQPSESTPPWERD